MSGAPPPPLPTSSTSPPPHRSLTVKTLSPSILIILLIVVVTVVASFSLCRILRCINNRFLRHISSSSADNGSALVSSRRVSPAETSAAVSDPVASLPVFAFSTIKRRRESSTAVVAADCAVCLSKFEHDDQVRLLPLCCHAFHVSCIDTWLRSQQTCPLCRSPISASDSELMTLVENAGSYVRGGDSFRLEIGNVSRRQTTTSNSSARRSYSIGSFDYLVDDESEVQLTNARNGSSDRKEEVIVVLGELPPPLPSEASLAADVANGRSWLKDFVDRLSSSSLRSSGRFFTGSSRRSEIGGEWISESGQLGVEFTEYFRWLSEV
ncbi:hypothetical protein ACLB2K_077095 [Fragaria x ananassa]